MPKISKFQAFDKIEVIRKVTGFTPAQKLLLLLISTHLGKNNFCFLSLTTLMTESGMSRTAVSDNLSKLAAVEVIIKLAPNEDFKSNRYGINFDLIVAQDYQCSSLGLLDQYSRTTRLVAQDYPKRKLNKHKRKLNSESLNFIDQKQEALQAKQSIKQVMKHIKR